jgi:threonyl-tRNA synthetase
VRLLILHVSHFVYTATQRGRSRLIEPLAEKRAQFDDGLLALAAAEPGDHATLQQVVGRAADDLARLAGQVGARRVLVHPFAHLFGEPAPLEQAVEVLDGLTAALESRGLEASRSPFGWFFSWELEAKGHPLSRVARRYVAETGRGSEETAAAPGA